MAARMHVSLSLLMFAWLPILCTAFVSLEGDCTTAVEDTTALLQQSAHLSSRSSLAPSPPFKLPWRKRQTESCNDQAGVPDRREDEGDAHDWVVVSQHVPLADGVRWSERQVSNGEMEDGVEVTEVVLKKSIRGNLHGRKGNKQFWVHVDDHVVLGNGAFGTVKAGYADLPGGQKLPLAVKYVSTSGIQERTELSNEVNVLVHLRKAPAYIVELYGFNEERGVVAMEPLMGGNLRDKKASFPLSSHNAKMVLQNVIQAVAACHKHHVAHRDLKEHQFVFQSEIGSSEGWGTTLKLVDFGTALRLEGKSFITRDQAFGQWNPGMIGTTPYTAPEVVYHWRGRNKAAFQMTTFSVYQPDVWAVGVIAYQVLTKSKDLLFIDELYWISNPEAASRGRLANFKTMIDALEAVTDEQIETLLQRNPEFFLDGDYSPAGDFIRQALKVDPGQRATSCGLLNHHWLTSGSRFYLDHHP